MISLHISGVGSQRFIQDWKLRSFSWEYRKYFQQLEFGYYPKYMHFFLFDLQLIVLNTGCFYLSKKPKWKQKQMKSALS